MQAPTISNLDYNPLNSYRIKYYGGQVFYEDNTQDNKNYLKSMDYSEKSPIRIHGKQSAVYLGESYLDLSKKKGQIVEIDISKELGFILKPSSVIAVTYKPLSWIEKKIDILAIENSHSLYTKIKGVIFI